MLFPWVPSDLANCCSLRIFTKLTSGKNVQPPLRWQLRGSASSPPEVEHRGEAMQRIVIERIKSLADARVIIVRKLRRRSHTQSGARRKGQGMVDPQSIFRAMKYRQDSRIQRIPNVKNSANIPQSSFEGKCTAFKEALFPPPPIADRPSWRNYQPTGPSGNGHP